MNPTATRRLRVSHATRYTYDRPMSRSAHLARLQPTHDRLQHLENFELNVEVDDVPLGEPVAEFPDVFGNVCHRFEVTMPYTGLSVKAVSEVDLHPVDAMAFAKEAKTRPQIPLNWMPRDRLVLSPFLTSVELPDAQLSELFAYATSFVKRNDGDLFETMFNINLELYKQYEYVPGSTTNATTPYDVMQSRRGVCQDFAQLFICLARLLGVPARYVCGYVFTGNTGMERAQSDASHAWVELYLPDVGWSGFDPTNGVLPALDHVRVAVGRFFRDATPTSGTLYGNAEETLGIDVEVKDVTAGDAVTN